LIVQYTNQRIEESTFEEDLMTRAKSTLRRGLWIVCAIGMTLPAQAQDDYATAILNDGPVAYYRFEDASDSDIVADASGNALDGTDLRNATLGGEGLIGNALELDGSGSILLGLTNNPADFNGSGADHDDFSIEFFTKLDTTPQQVFLAQLNGSPGTGRSIVIVTANGFFGSFLGGGTSNSTVVPEADRWYHIVMTYDGGDSTIRFYIDSDAVGSRVDPAENARGNWVLGAHKNRDRQYLDGLMDELSFWDYRLDDPDGDDDPADSKVREHYVAAFGETPACQSLDMTCSFSVEGVRVAFSAAPDGCDCPTVDLSLDGEVVAAGIALDVVTEVPLACEPRTEHTLEAYCAASDRTASCTFRCPGAESAYADTILADGPIAYYRFEEPGDSVPDVTGNGNDSVDVADVAPGVAGYLGNGAAFSGNGSIELGLSVDPSDSEGDGVDVGLNDFSIEAMIRTDVLGSTYVIASNKEQEGDAGPGRSNVLINPNGIASFIGGATTQTPVVPDLGGWYHVVVTYDGTPPPGDGEVAVDPEGVTVRVWVNGVMMGSGALVAESATGHWVLGAHKNRGSSFLSGMLDEVSFWDYRLDDPDGDDDIADSLVGAHYIAATGSDVPCQEVGLACAVNENDMLEVTVGPAPDGCPCDMLDIAIDGVPLEPIPFPEGGVFELPLPAECLPGIEHTIAVGCSGSVLVETCTFACPFPCDGPGIACEVNEEGALVVTVTPVPEGCDCAVVVATVDGEPYAELPVPPDGIFVVPLDPAECPAGTEHTLEVTCAEGGPAESCTFTCPTHPCETVGLACSVSEDGATLDVTLAPAPDGCDCGEVELRIGDALVDTVSSDAGAVSLALPDPCEPGTELTLEATCTLTGLSESCTFTCPSLEPQFRRGDANADGVADISDGIYVLGFLFLGGAAPLCDDAADTNDDGAVDLSDAPALFGFLFLGQAPPPSPLESCGDDPTDDALSCEAFPPCDG